MVSGSVNERRWYREVADDGMVRLVRLVNLADVGFSGAFRRRFGLLCHTEWPVCYWCGDDLKPANATIDHVHALGLGGTDTLDNIVPCCRSCNKLRSKEQSWQSQCERGLERYWYALERGSTPEEASEYARREQPLGTFYGTARGVPKNPLCA